MRPTILSFRWGLVISMLLLGLARAQTPEPLVRGIDHIPIVVVDLEKAEADFRALGFTIKPGRPHADGIRNAHVKFPDGTDMELITAPQAVDPLTTEYRAKLQSSEGPIYFGLYAPDITALADKLNNLRATVGDDGLLVFPPGNPLHPLFFGGRIKSPTDKPEYFSHPNTATRFSAVWVRDSQEMRGLLQRLGISLAPAHRCEMIGGSDELVAKLPEGDIYLVRSAAADIVAARVEVRSQVTLESVLKKNNVHFERDRRCDHGAVWVSPSSAHGIWIEFVKAKK